MFYSIITKTKECGFEDFRFSNPEDVPDVSVGPLRAYFKGRPEVVDFVSNREYSDTIMAAIEAIASRL